MSSADVQRFAKRSSITFKRAGKLVQVTGRFVYKSARYEVSGTIDPANRRFGPFEHDFTLAKRRVYDATFVIGTDTVRSEYRFGAATKGVRALVLRSHTTNGRSVILGAADGDEILPIIKEECDCGSRDAPRPMLVWADGNATKPVVLRFASARSVADIEGLAQVVQTTIARTNNGFLGDILGPLGGCIDYGLCLLSCVAEKLWCVVGNLGRPGGDILTTVCLAVPGSCIEWCGVTRPPF